MTPAERLRKAASSAREIGAVEAVLKARGFNRAAGRALAHRKGETVHRSAIPVGQAMQAARGNYWRGQTDKIH